MEKYMLLIWEDLNYKSVLEEIYLIPISEISDKELNYFKSINGCHIDVNKTPVLTNHVTNKRHYKFKKYKCNIKELENNKHNIQHIIICGFSD